MLCEETVSALLTLERSLTVEPHVLIQRGLAVEGSSTLVTLKRPFATMLSHVSLKNTGLREALIAL
jgi:hypothetical protein